MPKVKTVMLRRRLDPYHAIHAPVCDKDATDKETEETSDGDVLTL